MLVFLLLFCVVVQALYDPVVVDFEQTDGALDLIGAPIVTDATDWEGVHIAASSLADDFQRVAERRSSVIYVDQTNTSTVEQPHIILVGTLGASPVIQQLVDSGKVNSTDLAGKWETFATTLVDNPFPNVDRALVILGSDKRGTIFGIYTLSEQMGVSPWYWWSDVPPTRHSSIFAIPITTVQGPPTVKYRGLFINDEAPSLTTWVLEKIGPKYNVEFYKRVFELLLRLKANYLWPAMWPAYPDPGNSFFVDDPLNPVVADQYGIVVSTSHHEPMQRATNEWLTSGNGTWDWTKNKANITLFMVDGAQRAKGRESYVTIGMRGASDSGLSGSDPMAILRDVIATQRSIIQDVYGDAAGVNQVWALYKEVQALYEAGLQVPSDITLLFADDNYGNIRRLPTPSERQRTGGIGIYYHLEYVGSPRSYKWMNTNNLAKVHQQLSTAVEGGADRIWVFNVGDIKPMEAPLTLAMTLAWNASSVTTDTIPDFLGRYAAREFPSSFSSSISEILLRFNRLLGLRRLEAIDSTIFSVLNYNEAERVETNWTQLAHDAQQVNDQLPSPHRPAFFQLVLQPILSTSTYISLKIAQARNEAYGQQRRTSTNDWAKTALQLFDRDYDLIDEYNTLLDGKWNYIMGQPHHGYTDSFHAPSRDMIRGLFYVQSRQNSVLAVGQMGVSVEGKLGVRPGLVNEGSDLTRPSRGDLVSGVTLPPMDPFGPDRYIEVWGRGTPNINWVVTPSVSWITATPARGELSPGQWDQRVTLAVDWGAVPTGFNSTVLVHVNSTAGDSYEQVRVPVVKNTVPAGFRGYVESDKHVSIEAAHFTSASSGNDSYRVFPHLGSHTRSGPVGLTSTVPAIPGGPYLEYSFYQTSFPAAVNVNLHFTTTLDTDPSVPMTFGVAIDGTSASATRLLPAPATVGDLPTGWSDAVRDLVWKRTIEFRGLSPGAHTLRYWGGKPGILLEQIVIDMGGVRPSYMGPPESKRV